MEEIAVISARTAFLRVFYCALVFAVTLTIGKTYAQQNAKIRVLFIVTPNAVQHITNGPDFIGVQNSVGPYTDAKITDLNTMLGNNNLTGVEFEKADVVFMGQNLQGDPTVPLALATKADELADRAAIDNIGTTGKTLVELRADATADIVVFVEANATCCAGQSILLSTSDAVGPSEFVTVISTAV